jgi:hypothetical protein
VRLPLKRAISLAPALRRAADAIALTFRVDKDCVE